MNLTAISWVIPRILVIAYLGILVVGIIGRLDAPRLGVNVQEAPDGTFVITDVRLGGAVWYVDGQAGDILESIDGQPITTERWRAQPDRGKTFRLVRRETGEVLVGPSPDVGTFSIPITASLEIMGAIFALASIAVVYRTKRTPAVFVLSILLIAAASALAIAPATGRYHDWALLVEFIFVLLTSAALFGFFTVFPNMPGRPRSRRVFSALFMAVTAVALSLAFSVALWTGSESLYLLSRGLAFIHLAVGFLGGFALLSWSYVKDASPVAREQLRSIVMGTAFAVLPFVLLAILPQFVGVRPIVAPEVAILSFVLIPLSFTYAILRHQLMGIRRLVHRGVAYGFISAAALLMYAALIGTIGSVSGETVAADFALQTVLLVLLLVAMPAISGSRRLAFAAVDKVLYREPTDYPAIVRTVMTQASVSDTLDNLSAVVLRPITDDLRLTFAVIFESSRGKLRLRASVGEVPGDLAAAISSSASADGAWPQERFLAEVPSLSAEAVVVPIEGDAGGPMTLLCFGPKIMEEPFRQDDLNALQTISVHAGTIIQKLAYLDELHENAEALQNLNHQLVNVQEAERRDIAEYLHNEPLQVLTFLSWQADLHDAPEEMRDVLKQLSGDLREFTTQLQPAVLDNLGLVAALEWLTEKLEDTGECDASFSSSGVAQSDRFDRDTELALYRVVQEALRNCEKHSEASQVWVSLSSADDVLEVRVRDDGKGFDDGTPGARPKSLGIMGMRERMGYLGGSFEVESDSVAGGTTLIARVPLTRESPGGARTNGKVLT